MEQQALSWLQVILFDVLVIGIVYLGQKSKNKYIVFLAFIALVCASGLRHGYIDTRQYRSWFDGVDSQRVLTFDYIFNGTDKDRGFHVLIGIIKLFTDDSQVFLFIFALITIACLFYGIKNNIDNSLLTIFVFLFITTGCFVDTMNGLRQAFVGAVLFALMPKFIREKKLIRYMLIVLLLSSVHQSVLIFIPLYFLVDSTPWGKLTWIILGVGAVLYLFFNLGISNAVVDFLEGTEYAVYANEIANKDIGVNPIRPLVAIAPVALSFLTRKEEKVGKIYNVAFYMSLFNIIIWLLAVKARYFYRLGTYFQPYMILLICYEIASIKNRDLKAKIIYSVIILFVIWHWYSLYTMGDQFFVGYLKY